MRGRDWVEAGQGWQGAESELRLSGWGRARRAIVLRRRVKKDLAVVDQRNPRQLRLRSWVVKPPQPQWLFNSSNGFSASPWSR